MGTINKATNIAVVTVHIDPDVVKAVRVKVGVGG
jgi:hypothetical protein